MLEILWLSTALHKKRVLSQTLPIERQKEALQFFLQPMRLVLARYKLIYTKPHYGQAGHSSAKH